MGRRLRQRVQKAAAHWPIYRDANGNKTKSVETTPTEGGGTLAIHKDASGNKTKSVETTPTKSGGTLAIHKDASGSETERVETKVDKSSITTTPKDGGRLVVYKDAGGQETERVETKQNGLTITTTPRFTLTQKADKTYALTIAEGVQTIAEGEFSAVESSGTGEKALETTLTGRLGAKPAEAITTITLPSTLTGIGDYAFYTHSAVKSVRIPEKVETIGTHAFGKTGIANIEFEDDSKLDTVGAAAFDLAKIKQIQAPRYTLTKNADNTTYALAVADGVTSIARGEFASGSETNLDGSIKTALDTRLKRSLLGAEPDEAITTIALPSTLTRIEDYAFFGHVSVKGTLTIPAQVQSIGKKAFRYVGELEAGVSLTFANGSQLTTIGDSAFDGSHLSSFAPLPEQLETIGSDAFFSGKPTTVQDTSSLIIPAKVKTIGSLAFYQQKFKGSATLTIRSLHLEKTASTTPIGAKLFVLGSTSPPPFTTIKLPKAVYDSYTKVELEDRFGVVTDYQELNGTPHTPK